MKVPIKLYKAWLVHFTNTTLSFGHHTWEHTLRKQKEYNIEQQNAYPAYET